MGQLLEHAAQRMTGIPPTQEYPCKLCSQKFSNLYGVKLHILECHEDFVGQQVIKKERDLGVRRMKMKHKRQKKITHTKKPWCNYCWIKFKTQKEYKDHRMACPNRPSGDSQEAATLLNAPQTVENSACPKSPRGSLKIETKVDEEINVIKDIPAIDTNPVPIRPLKVSKLNMVKSKTDQEASEELQEEAKCKDATDVKPDMEEEDIKEASDNEMDVTQDLPEDDMDMTPEEPISPSPNWRDEDRERVRRCPVPIGSVTIIMPERAERILELDSRGTYLLTELEQLGLTVDQFAADTTCGPFAPDTVCTPDIGTLCGQSTETESPILSKLLDRPSGHNCSLCTSAVLDLRTHITSYHKLSIDSYLKVFPGDLVKLNTKRVEENIRPSHGSIRVKTESVLLAPPEPAELPKPEDLGYSVQYVTGHVAKKNPGRPWYESVKTNCRICGKQFWHGQFVKHVKYEHATPLKQYRDMYPDERFETGQYQCLVCNSYVAHYSSPVSGHLTSKHGMTITEYYESYERFRERNEKGEELMRRKGEEKGKQKSTNQPQANQVEHSVFGLTKSSPQPQYTNPSSVPIKTEPETSKIPEGRMVMKEEGKEMLVVVDDASKKFRCKICHLLVSLTKDSITDHMQRVHGDLVNHVPGIETLVTPSQQLETPVASLQPAVSASSAPWYNKCTWTCLLCSKTFCSGFWKHVNEKHSLKKEDYLRHYGKQGIQIVHYFCRICDKKVPWSGASINAHTKATHCLSLQEYESIYELPAQKLETGTSITDPEPVQETGLIESPEFQRTPLPQPPKRSGSTEKWFNGCEYTCQICFTALHSVAGLSVHLREIHAMEKLEYFKQFGRDGIKVRKYSCKICANTFPWSGVSIAKHLTQSHQMSLQEYTRQFEAGRTFQHVVTSDEGLIMPVQSSTFTFPVQQAAVARPLNVIVEKPAASWTSKSSQYTSLFTSQGHLKKMEKWYNKCSWNCQLCGRHFKTNASSMFKHVTQDHKVPVEEYKEKFGNTGTTFVDHTCRLCFKKVPCNGLAMCKHFKHSHSLSLEEYEQLYMVGDDGTSDSVSYVPTQDHWYNKCVWKCQICGKENKSQGSSKKHVAQMHKITYEEYYELFGNQGITEVSFTCIICQMVVSCNGVSIASHLNGIHKITLQEYEAAYLKDVELLPQTNMPLAVKDMQDVSGASTSQVFQMGEIGLDVDDTNSIVSIDDNSICDPLTQAQPENVGFDPLAGIAIGNIVSIEDPDFPETSLENERNQELDISDSSPRLLSSPQKPNAVVIHDIGLLEGVTKKEIL